MGCIPLFQEGQEFILNSPYLCPEGFYTWACTDGVRPVFFKVERTDT